MPRLPSDPAPTYEELLARIEKLEAAGGTIKLKDLPVQQLQSKLETDWQPNPGVLFAGRSIPDSALEQRPLAGAVTSAGNVLMGTGFSVVRNAVGDYTITYNEPYDAAPIVTPTAGTTVAAYSTKVVSTTRFAVQIHTFTTTTGALVDGEFYFQTRQAA